MLVVGAVGDLDPAQRSKVGQEAGQIEGRGDRLSPAGLADEREIEHRDEPVVDQPGHLAQPVQPVARPGRAVDDQPLGVREQVAGLAGPERRLTGPPDRDRQVMDEQRLDDRRDVPPGIASGRHVDRLRAGLGGTLTRQHAVGADPGVEPTGAVGVGGRADQGARRVTTGELGDDRRAVLADLRPAGDHHQVHHARSRGDVPLVALGLGGQRGQCPDLGQLALDAVDRRRAGRPAQRRLAGTSRADVQILRHRRSSRAISSSASAGPHVPAA